MNRRAFLTAAAGSLALFGQGYSGSPAGHHVPDPSLPARPNVIWVIADQFRAQALSRNGDPNARTPNLERAEVNGWKLVCTENFTWLLFNLNEDPYEEANQAQNNEHRAERKRLLARLKQWVTDTGDRFSVSEA